jgi:hypothetical protein
VEAVKNNAAVFQESSDPVQAGIPHIAADDVDLVRINPSRPEILDERLEDGPVPAFPQENDPRRLEMAERSHVDVALEDGELVDAQRKSAARTFPRRLDLLDPAFPAANPWHPGMEIGPVLEEIKMTPGPVQTIVNLALLGLLARGTGKLGALDEVEPEIESTFLFGKLQIDDSLRLGQSECHGNQGEFIHRGVSFRNWKCLGCYHALILSLNLLEPHEIEKNRFFN